MASLSDALRPKPRKRRPPSGRRCEFCSGWGVQATICSGDYCSCGGDGHTQTCYWCGGKGTKKAMEGTIAANKQRSETMSGLEPDDRGPGS